MGAKQVAQEAATLESWIRRGVPVVLADLAAAIDEATDSIETLNTLLSMESNVGRASARPGRAEARPTSALLPIAQKMREHLDANNLAAVDCFADLKAAIGSSEPLRMLEESLDRLDFAAARRYLDQIEANA